MSGQQRSPAVPQAPDDVTLEGAWKYVTTSPGNNPEPLEMTIARIDDQTSRFLPVTSTEIAPAHELGYLQLIYRVH